MNERTKIFEPVDVLALALQDMGHPHPLIVSMVKTYLHRRFEDLGLDDDFLCSLEEKIDEYLPEGSFMCTQGLDKTMTVQEAIDMIARKPDEARRNRKYHRSLGRDDFTDN